MDRLEELWSWRDSEPIRIRAVCQAEEPPHQGLPQIKAGLLLDDIQHCEMMFDQYIEKSRAS